MEYVEKVIDEKIQGKALVTEKKRQNTKKLFIGSYVC
jgi:tRNA-2-methylthio-N6-dimethylallyladenosine synthase